ncbi:MAG: HpcH/HpaI aldolase family protein [Bacillota bacterium]
MFNNKLKKALYEGKACFGTLICNNSPDIVEICGLVGFDFVILDIEHGYMSPETTVNLIRAAEVTGMTPITRVTENSETIILRSLDVGSHGVQIPQVNDAASARLAVQRAKYYPEGMRGVAFPRSSNYGLNPVFDYFKQANDETLVVVHCENVSGLANIEEIAAVPGVDVIFLGPFDLSQSMGIPGRVESPPVQEAANRVVKVCQRYGKIPGIYCNTAEEARQRADQGFKYLPIGMDSTLIAQALKRVVDKVKSR